MPTPSCGPSRRTRCCGRRSRRWRSSTGRSTATGSPRPSTAPPGIVPRLRQRVQSNPLSIAPPRWEVDPNFDLDFHVRWLRPAAGGSLRDVLDLAEPIAMQGFDRARPLWEVDVVEGLDEGRSALILKLHHAITDGVGGVKLAMHLFDLDRDGTDQRRAAGRAAGPRDEPARADRSTPSTTSGAAALGIARRSAATVAGAAASVASRRRRHRAPPGRHPRVGRAHAGPGHQPAVRRAHRPLALGALRRAPPARRRPEGRGPRRRRQAQRRLRRRRRRRPAALPPPARLGGRAPCA